MVQSNSIQLEKLLNKCMATETVQSNNILLENSTKKTPIKYCQTIQTHNSQPQSQSTFECSTQMTLTK